MSSSIPSLLPLNRGTRRRTLWSSNQTQVDRSVRRETCRRRRKGISANRRPGPSICANGDSLHPLRIKLFSASACRWSFIPGGVVKSERGEVVSLPRMYSDDYGLHTSCNPHSPSVRALRRTPPGIFDMRRNWRIAYGGEPDHHAW